MSAQVTTAVYVTHDQVEAMTMADRIVVLDRGQVQQVGTPLELYNRPDNLFVAGFIGSPRMNFIVGEEAARLEAATIGIRPEHIRLDPAGRHGGTIRLAEHLGSDTFLHVDAGPLGALVVRATGEFPAVPGGAARFAFPPERIHRFQADGKVLRA